jgi:hypothetical protein
MQYFNMYTRHHPPILEMDLAALNGAADDYEIEIITCAAKLNVPCIPT